MRRGVVARATLTGVLLLLPSCQAWSVDVAEALAEIRFSVLIDEHKKDANAPPDHGVADWFAQWQLQARPAFTPIEGSGATWKAGPFLASLDAGEVLNWTDGTITIETSGNWVSDGKVTSFGTFTVEYLLKIDNSNRLFTIQEVDFDYAGSLAGDQTFRKAVHQELRAKALEWLDMVESRLEAEAPGFDLEGRLLIVQDRDFYTPYPNPAWKEDAENVAYDEYGNGSPIPRFLYTFASKESWVSFFCAGNPKP